MKYQVTWGSESLVVEAGDESAAFAKFCDLNEVARRHPRLHARKVLEVTEEPQRVLLVEASEPVVKTVLDLLDPVLAKQFEESEESLEAAE